MYYNYEAINATNQTNVAINTGADYLMKVGSDSWAELSAIFESVGFNCSSLYCGSSSKCSDIYDELNYLKVVIDNQAYWIPPQGYLWSVQSVSNDTCVAAITWEEGAEIELGT